MSAQKVKRKQHLAKVEPAAVRQLSETRKEISGEMTDQQLAILIGILVVGFLFGLLAISVKVAL